MFPAGAWLPALVSFSLIKTVPRWLSHLSHFLRVARGGTRLQGEAGRDLLNC